MSKKKLTIISFFTTILILFTSIPLIHADRCILPITDVDVYGPGQKAIIAWNGETERLILSTDLYASADVQVLEILPLPSKPSVEKGSFESFEAVQRLMMENMPEAAAPGREFGKGLEIVFHKRIGAHDITVVKATSTEELLKFLLSYTKEMNISQTSFIREKTRLILEDYLIRKFNYWVFDLVDLYSTARTTEPIAYEFQSSSLYYPMKVSATAKGHVEIILYLIIPEAIGEDEIPSKMEMARYLPSDQIIQFKVSHDDLAMIDNGISSLFGPKLMVYPSFPAAYLTAVKYEGELSDLDFDLEIPPRPVSCRSIKVGTDKTQYCIGETVKIALDFIHLMPGCFEIEVLHFHKIRLKVFDSSGGLIQSWQWNVNDDLHKTIKWKPVKEGEYIIMASSWWDDEKQEVEDQSVITVSSSISPPPSSILVDSKVRWLLYGVIIAVVCILIGAGLTYLLLRKHK